MSPSLAINARYQVRRITGVDRYAHEIAKRLTLLKRFINPSHPLGQVSGHVWEQFSLPSHIQRDELLWSPANAGPWSVTRQVLTIHDASVFDHPAWFRPAFAAWTRLSWKILARRVKAIITVSKFSKQRLKHHLGIPDEKIHVIYNGVGDPFEPQPTKCIKNVKEKLGIRKPYFLFVGTIEPRKNLNHLLEAWEQANISSHDLFLAGTEGNVFPISEKQLALSSHIPDEDLPSLYAGATAFVFPSLYEGFGLPVLEAMACGTPVITSNTTALAEIFSDAALLVAPEKPVEIKRAMQTLLEDKSLAGNLREQGLRKANRLSWETSAVRTQSLFESLI